MRRALVPILLLFSASFLLAAEPATWTIDPGHSHVGFSVRHMMVSNVRGNFEKFSGSIVGDPSDPEKAKVEVSIDASSLTTHNANRDEHLRGADFFDVTKFPTITFRSKRVEKGKDGTLRVIGDLTLRGVTKEVALEVEGPTPEIEVRNTKRIGLSASTKLNRKDYGLNWNRIMEAGGVTVGDDVKVSIELELIKRPTDAAPAPGS